MLIASGQVNTSAPTLSDSSPMGAKAGETSTVVHTGDYGREFASEFNRALGQERKAKAPFSEKTEKRSSDTSTPAKTAKTAKNRQKRALKTARVLENPKVAAKTVGHGKAAALGSSKRPEGARLAAQLPQAAERSDVQSEVQTGVLADLGGVVDEKGGTPKKSREPRKEKLTGRAGESQIVQFELGAKKSAAALPKRDAGDSGAVPVRQSARHHKTGRKVIEIRDYRTAGTAEGGSAENRVGTAEPLDAADQDVEVRLVRSAGGRSETSAPTTAKAGRTESPFTAYVRENLSSQIVKQTGIILRNNDRGEILLVLRPENLGRVRMRIQLDGNRLSGRIFVDSSLVKESFEQSLEELYRAFRDNGYETSEFEVLVDGRSEGHAGGEKQRNGLSAKTLKQLEDAVPILEEIDHQSELINLVI